MIKIVARGSLLVACYRSLIPDLPVQAPYTGSQVLYTQTRVSSHQQPATSHRLRVLDPEPRGMNV